MSPFEHNAALTKCGFDASKSKGEVQALILKGVAHCVTPRGYRAKDVTATMRMLISGHLRGVLRVARVLAYWACERLEASAIGTARCFW